MASLKREMTNISGEVHPTTGHRLGGMSDGRSGATYRNIRYGLATMLALAAGLLAACGSDTTSTQPRGNSSSNVAQAKKELAPYLKLPGSIGLTEPLSRRPAGKTVAFLQCGIVNCEEHAKALRKAFAQLGVNFKVISSGLSPETFTKAFSTVSQIRPDAVLYDGIPAAIAQRPSDELAKDGIPVVGIATPDLKTGDNIFAIEGPEFYRDVGRTMANWTIVNSNGNASVLYVRDPSLPFGDPELAGLMKAFRDNCDRCNVDEIKTSASGIGKSIPQEVTGYLQQHPKTKYVIGMGSAFLIGVPTALKTAGITGVQLVGFAPTRINQEALKAGQEAAGLMQSNDALSWYAADATARALVGQSAPRQAQANPPIMQLVTTSKVTWQPSNGDWPYIPGWESEFTHLWTK
jgi:ABC-type sugar transport system substrate-binding protein